MPDPQAPLATPPPLGLLPCDRRDRWHQRASPPGDYSLRAVTIHVAEGSLTPPGV